MKLAGVDLSTWAIDVVTINLDTGRLNHHTFPLEGTDAWERTRNIRTVMPTRTDELWDDVIAIGIEDPRGYGAGRLFRIQGAVLACLPVGVLIQPYVPARWRVLSGIPGHALKTAVKDRSVELGAPEHWKQDGHDAHLIARAMQTELEAQKAA